MPAMHQYAVSVTCPGLSVAVHLAPFVLGVLPINPPCLSALSVQGTVGAVVEELMLYDPWSDMDTKVHIVCCTLSTMQTC